jgi:hypothetical protein
LPDSTAGDDGNIVQIEAKLDAGEDFWQAIWQPFLRRDLNRSQVREVLARGYAGNQFSLKKLSQAWRIEERDFKKFIAILHKYEIHPKTKA